MLKFVPITVHPSKVGDEEEVHRQNMEWIEVAPNEEMPFEFHRKQKIRHKVQISCRPADSHYGLAVTCSNVLLKNIVFFDFRIIWIGGYLIYSLAVSDFT